MADQSVLESVHHYLRNLEAQGMGVSFAVLFGSHARGDVHEWSDIDVVVVSPRFDPPNNRADVSLLWRVAAHTDSRIEPVPCGARQWDEDQSSVVIEAARREGTRILPAA